MYIFVRKKMKTTHYLLLFTLFFNLNLFAQYSGEGVFLNINGKSITVKWSNNANEVQTRTATYVGESNMTNYMNENGKRYKINNNNNYFVLLKGVPLFNSYSYEIHYFNELGSLYWKAKVD